LYARAPIICAICSPCCGVTEFGLVCRKSCLQPTRITGIVGPHIDRTSSIH
jgi:hypothetical protein